MLALHFFLLLLRAVPLLGTVEIGLELFLNSRVPSSILYLRDNLQDVAHEYAAHSKNLAWGGGRKTVSAYEIEDFLRQHATWSETCAAFQLRNLEVVIVGPVPFRVLRRVLPKVNIVQ